MGCVIQKRSSYLLTLDNPSGWHLIGFSSGISSISKLLCFCCVNFLAGLDLVVVVEDVVVVVVWSVSNCSDDSLISSSVMVSTLAISSFWNSLGNLQKKGDWSCKSL